MKTDICEYQIDDILAKTKSKLMKLIERESIDENQEVEQLMETINNNNNTIDSLRELIATHGLSRIRGYNVFEDAGNGVQYARQILHADMAPDGILHIEIAKKPS